MTSSLISHNQTLTAESPALEVAGCEWCYALLVVQASNNDDYDDDHDACLIFEDYFEYCPVSVSD